ncbi:MAG: putative toxin-antitoxin system toxin component, PIN family [Acidobacteria bacterium]|nr:putative toxin-antitoxin system toxin component, PIN family [Acidobacteriota bacterium]
MRVVCDTNILARCFPNQSGPSRRLLDALFFGEEHVLVISPEILDELEETLAYPRIRRRWATTPEAVSRYRSALERFSHVVEAARGPRIVPGDPDDDVVIYTAIAGRADVICTRDQHLLQPDVLAFCQRRGLRVMSDLEILAEL